MKLNVIELTDCEVVGVILGVSVTVGVGVGVVVGVSVGVGVVVGVGVTKGSIDSEIMYSTIVLLKSGFVTPLHVGVKPTPTFDDEVIGYENTIQPSNNKDKYPEPEPPPTIPT